MAHSNNPSAQPPVSTPVTPKDAAAMILLRDPDDPKVFWVKRGKTLAFMANYHAFPGGQRDADDAEVPILNAENLPDAVMRVTALREIFEETGVLMARGVESLSAERRAAMRDELHAGQASFKELLEREGLALDASLLIEAPRWVTQRLLRGAITRGSSRRGCPRGRRPRSFRASLRRANGCVRRRRCENGLTAIA